MSNIEWTDRTWNPVRGCTRVSEGCRNCYAERQAIRHARPGGTYDGLARSTESGPRWTGKVAFVEHKLDEPLSWREPARVFVNSMSDLFHEGLTNEQIAAVFAVMALAPQHTFQVLTKRPERMRAWFAWAAEKVDVDGNRSGPAALRNAINSASAFAFVHRAGCGLLREGGAFCDCDRSIPDVWPLTNVWLGVSVEHQKAADERIPLLLQTPAAVRFLSVEPLLGPVDLSRWFYVQGFKTSVGPEPEKIDWVIVGGESGPGARPCDVAWVRSVVEQCRAAGVPCFVKQLGAAPINGAAADDYIRIGTSAHRIVVDLKSSKGGDPFEWPADLRVRQFPEVRDGR